MLRIAMELPCVRTFNNRQSSHSRLKRVWSFLPSLIIKLVGNIDKNLTFKNYVFVNWMSMFLLLLRRDGENDRGWR